MRQLLLLLFSFSLIPINQSTAADTDLTASLTDPITRRIPYHIEWETDYDKALSLSKSTGKPLLLLFTGSDWCGWCIKLEDEALHTEAFAKKAQDKFIFVKLDFPVRTKLDRKIVQQNRKLKRQYGIQGFPTIILADGDERVIAETGYEPGGGSAYAEHLLSLTSRF